MSAILRYLHESFTPICVPKDTFPNPQCWVDAFLLSSVVTVQTKRWLVDIMSHDNNNILSCDWCSVITRAMLGCDWCRAVTVETWAPLLPPRCRFWHLAQQTENRDHKHGIHWTRTRPSSLQWTQPFIFYKNRYLDVLLKHVHPHWNWSSTVKTSDFEMHV